MTDAAATDRPILVVGSVNVDLTLRLPRLPAPGETVIGGRSHRALGGKGANQAATVAALGGRVVLCARVGADVDGEFARQELGRAGVDVSAVRTDSDAPTGLATILVDDGGENQIGVASGANARLDATDVRAVPVAPAAVVANLEVPLAAVQAGAELARAAGCPFVLNPAPARPLPVELLELVSVLTPNEGEHAALELADFSGAVVLTRGRRGLDLIVAGQLEQRIPAYPVAGVDSTGAGDACTGAIAWALATGRPLPEAARIGAAAGALATRGVGAQASLPDAAAVAELITAHGHPGPRSRPS